MIKQISVFLPNQPGTLANLTKLLMENSINLRASTVSEMVDYGILKIIVDKTSECIKILEDHGYLTVISEVIAVAVPDKPGALHEVVKLFGDNNLNIEYLYSAIVNDEAVIIFRVLDTKRAIELLQSKNVKIVDRL